MKPIKKAWQERLWDIWEFSGDKQELDRAIEFITELLESETKKAREEGYIEGFRANTTENQKVAFQAGVRRGRKYNNPPKP